MVRATAKTRISVPSEPLLATLPWSCTHFGGQAEIEACTEGVWRTVATVHAVAGVDAEDVAALIVCSVKERATLRGLVQKMANVLAACLVETAVPEKLRRKGAELLAQVRGL